MAAAASAASRRNNPEPSKAKLWLMTTKAWDYHRRTQQQIDATPFSHSFLDGGVAYNPIDGDPQLHQLIAEDRRNNVPLSISVIATPVHPLYADLDGLAYVDLKEEHYLRLGRCGTEATLLCLQEDTPNKEHLAQCCVSLTSSVKVSDTDWKFGLHLVFPYLEDGHVNQLLWAEQLSQLVRKALKEPAMANAIHPWHSEKPLVDLGVYESADNSWLRMNHTWKVKPCPSCGSAHADSAAERRKPFAMQSQPLLTKCQDRIDKCVEPLCGGVGKIWTKREYRLRYILDAQGDPKAHAAEVSRISDPAYIEEELALTSIRSRTQVPCPYWRNPVGGRVPAGFIYDAEEDDWRFSRTGGAPTRTGAAANASLHALKGNIVEERLFDLNDGLAQQLVEHIINARPDIAEWSTLSFHRLVRKRPGVGNAFVVGETTCHRCARLDGTGRSSHNSKVIRFQFYSNGDVKQLCFGSSCKSVLPCLLPGSLHADLLSQLFGDSEQQGRRLQHVAVDAPAEEAAPVSRPNMLAAVYTTEEAGDDESEAPPVNHHHRAHNHKNNNGPSAVSVCYGNSHEQDDFYMNDDEPEYVDADERRDQQETHESMRRAENRKRKHQVFHQLHPNATDGSEPLIPIDDYIKIIGDKRTGVIKWRPKVQEYNSRLNNIVADIRLDYDIAVEQAKHGTDGQVDTEYRTQAKPVMPVAHGMKPSNVTSRIHTRYPNTSDHTEFVYVDPNNAYGCAAELNPHEHCRALYNKTKETLRTLFKVEDGKIAPVNPPPPIGPIRLPPLRAHTWLKEHPKEVTVLRAPQELSTSGARYLLDQYWHDFSVPLPPEPANYNLKRSEMRGPVLNYKQNMDRVKAIKKAQKANAKRRRLEAAAASAAAAAAAENSGLAPMIIDNGEDDDAEQEKRDAEQERKEEEAERQRDEELAESEMRKLEEQRAAMDYQAYLKRTSESAQYKTSAEEKRAQQLALALKSSKLREELKEVSEQRQWDFEDATRRNLFSTESSRIQELILFQNCPNERFRDSIQIDVKNLTAQARAVEDHPDQFADQAEERQEREARRERAMAAKARANGGGRGGGGGRRGGGGGGGGRGGRRGGDAYA